MSLMMGETPLFWSEGHLPLVENAVFEPAVPEARQGKLDEMTAEGFHRQALA